MNPVGVTIKPHSRYLGCGFSISAYHQHTTKFKNDIAFGRISGPLSLLVIPSFKEIAVLVNDGSKLGDFRADFDTIVTKTCTFM